MGSFLPKIEGVYHVRANTIHPADRYRTMIPHSNIREVRTGGVTNKKTFGITNNAKMFKILSSGIYKNKVLAPLRECSCNAYDSHVAVGKKDVPIKVHLPTALEAWFSVEDFGLGLSHEDVMDLYTTYGMSTKEGSNDFIGALGLGSKSPFAYTDAYTVVSTFNGVRRNYGCYIDENGEPQISSIGNDIFTNDVNGLKISFNTRKGDDHAFLEAAREFFKHFPTKPDFNLTVDIEKPDYLYEGDGWALIKRVRGTYYPSSRSNSVAVMGSVSYPIDIDSLNLGRSGHVGDTEQKEKIRALLHEGVILVFALGELDIAVSREDLGYNDRTIQTIINKGEEVHALLIKKIEEGFTLCNTWWEATTKYYEVQKQMGRDFTNIAKEAEWRGIPLLQTRGASPFTASERLKGVGLSFVHEYDIYRRKRISFYNDGSPFLPGNKTQNTIVLYADQHEERVPHIHQRLMKWVKEAHPGKEVLVVWSSDATKTKREGEAHVIKAIGSPPYEVISKVVPLYVGEFGVIKNGKRTVSRFFKRTDRPGQFGYDKARNLWTDARVDVSTTKGYYINLHSWEPVDSNLDRLDNLKALCIREGLVPHDFFYYGVPGTYRKFLDDRVKYPDWEDAGVYLRNLLRKRTKTKEFKHLYESAIFTDREALFSATPAAAIAPLEGIATSRKRIYWPKELFGTVWREASEESKTTYTIANYTLDMAEKERIIGPYRERLTKSVKDILNKYPLITYLNLEHKEEYEAFLVYKKQIDKLHKLNLI